MSRRSRHLGASARGNGAMSGYCFTVSMATSSRESDRRRRNALRRIRTLVGRMRVASALTDAGNSRRTGDAAGMTRDLQQGSGTGASISSRWLIRSGQTCRYGSIRTPGRSSGITSRRGSSRSCCALRTPLATDDGGPGLQAGPREDRRRVARSRACRGRRNRGSFAGAAPRAAARLGANEGRLAALGGILAVRGQPDGRAAARHSVDAGDSRAGAAFRNHAASGVSRTGG